MREAEPTRRAVLGAGAGPLVALAVVSDRWRSRVLSTLTAHRSLVNRGRAP